MAVEAVTKWMVGDRMFDTEAEAIRHEKYIEFRKRVCRWVDKLYLPDTTDGFRIAMAAAIVGSIMDGSLSKLMQDIEDKD